MATTHQNIRAVMSRSHCLIAVCEALHNGDSRQYGTGNERAFWREEEETRRYIVGMRSMTGSSSSSARPMAASRTGWRATMRMRR